MYTDTSHVGLLLGNLLFTNLELDFFAIVQLLQTSTMHVNHKAHKAETALYPAVQSGRLEDVTMLLEMPGKIASCVRCPQGSL